MISCAFFIRNLYRPPDDGDLTFIFGRRKFGLCKKNFPNSLGGLALKGLLLLFDISIFVWRCFNWGVKQPDENDMAVSKEFNFFT